MKKRIFAFLLVILMVFSLVPTSIFAQEIVSEQPKEEITEEVEVQQPEEETAVLPQEPTEEEKEDAQQSEPISEELPIKETESENLAVANQSSIGVWVNGINISKGGYWKNNGKKGTKKKYNIYYNKKKQTLTLNKAKLTKFVTLTDEGGTNTNASIISDSNLTVVLKGKNTIAPNINTATYGILTNGNLKIDGGKKKNGKLYVTGNSYGITAKGNINVYKVGYLSINSVQPFCFGLFSDENNLTVDQSKIYVKNGMMGVAAEKNINIKKSTVTATATSCGVLSGLNMNISSSTIYVNNTKLSAFWSEKGDATLTSSNIYIGGTYSESDRTGFKIKNNLKLAGSSNLKIRDIDYAVKAEKLISALDIYGHFDAMGTIKTIDVNSYEYQNSNRLRTGENANNVLIYPKVYAKSISGSHNKLLLSWTKKEGAEGYQIQMYSKKKWKTIGETTQTDYTAASLKANSSYKFRIRSYVTVNAKKQYSNYISSITGKTAIATPSVTAKNSAGNIKLTWKKIKGASYYNIYKTYPNGYTSTYTTKKTSFTDTDVAAGNVFEYQVEAVREATFGYYTNCKSAKSQAKKVTALFKTPSKFAVTKTAEKKAKISFEIPTSYYTYAGYEAKYTIYRATKKKGKYKAITTVNLNTGNMYNQTFIDTGVKKGKTYYYKMRVSGKINGKTYNSSYTGIKKIKIK